LTWTRITDPDEAASLLPAWFVSRMIGLRGRFGLLLTTGEILRITSVTALHESPHGVILLDVLLDHGGVPDGVDEAWRTKCYLGAPGLAVSSSTRSRGSPRATEMIATDAAWTAAEREASDAC